MLNMVYKLVTIVICFTNIDDLNGELFLEYRGRVLGRQSTVCGSEFHFQQIQVSVQASDVQCSLFIYCKMLVYAYSSYLKRSRRGMLVKYVNYV